MSMRIPSHITLAPAIMERLMVLAKRSLETLDVPIAAVLMYGETVIGEGFNTVLRNSQAGEHAEINAISSAMKELGMEEFRRLDRKNSSLSPPLNRA